MRRSHNNPARFLLVEDDNERAAYMLTVMLGPPWPAERPQPVVVRKLNSKTAIRHLQQVARGVEPPLDAIFLDYDIDFPGGGGGDKVVRAIVALSYEGVIVVHSANPIGGPRMARDLWDAGYQPVYAPVTDGRSPGVLRQVALAV